MTGINKAGPVALKAAQISAAEAIQILGTVDATRIQGRAVQVYQPFRRRRPLPPGGLE